MALYSQHVNALTFEEYITDHDSTEMRSYLVGYSDSIHNNAYLLGGCPRKLQYRPYGEYFQHIDIYIAKKTKDDSTNLDSFYQEPVEPLLTAVILKYVDCKNPEAVYLENENKNLQIAIREIAREIMDKTKKYQTPEEREKDFQYSKYLNELKNPNKFEIKSSKEKQKKIEKHYEKNKPLSKSLKNMPKAIEKPEDIQPKAKPEISQTVKEEEINTSPTDSFPADATQNQQQNPNPIPVVTDVPPKQEVKIKEKPQESQIIQLVKKDEKPVQKQSEANKALDELKSQPLLQTTASKKQEKPQAVKEEKKKDQNPTPVENPLKIKEDLINIPAINIPDQIQKKQIQESDVTDVKTKKYELDSLNINLDNINDVSLPST